jgi:hypothetical protein
LSLRKMFVEITFGKHFKSKVKFNLEQDMKAHRVCSLSLTSALDWVGGQRHAPAALLQGKRPGTHCMGGWLGPRAGLNG